MSELLVQRRSRGNVFFWRLYMLSWAMLAGAALAYLANSTIATGDPGKLAAAKPPQSNQESNRAELERDELTKQVRSLHKTVSSLRSDLARYKDQSRQSAEREQVAQSTSDASVRDSGDKNAVVSPIATGSIKNAPAATETQSSPTAGTAATNTATRSFAPILRPGSETSAPPDARKPTPPLIPDVVNKPVGTTEVAAATPEKPRHGRNLATTPLRAGRVPPLPGFNETIRPKASPQPTPANSQSQGATNPFQSILLNSGSNPSVPAAGSGQQVTSRQAAPGRAANPISTSSLPKPTRPATTNPTEPAIVKTPGSQVPVFGSPKVKPRKTAATAVAVALSSATSVTGLRASWLLLTTRHPDVFAAYSPRYVADQVTGNYRLLAGPIVDRSEADRVCTDLRARGITCGVSDYVGSALQ